MARKKNPPRKQILDPKPKISTKNSYEILNQLLEDEEIQDPHEPQQVKGKNQNPSPPTQIVKSTQKRGEMQMETSQCSWTIEI